MESRLQSGSAPGERLVLKMNTADSLTLAAKVPAYAELQREMHDALRAQHPEWVQPNGDSPMCDAYESRLEELLSLSLQFERAPVPIMPARHAEARNTVFHNAASVGGSCLHENVN